MGILVQGRVYYAQPGTLKQFIPQVKKVYTFLAVSVMRTKMATASIPHSTTGYIA